MVRETPPHSVPALRGGRTALTEQAQALLAGTTARDKLADEIVVLDVSALTTVADFLVICSGESTRQVKAVAEAVDEALSREGVRLLRSEGVEHGRWILLDYGAIIVHVFHREARQFYNLDRLWADASTVALPPQQRSPERRRQPSRENEADLL
ncbi:MAG: ribosome silencing factor [Nitrospirae bacterium]|nr:ribosome silencing factor [Nitrospirota bacterium]